MEEKNWYLYRHLKPNGEVFYIGIGNTKKFRRAYEKGNRRSEYWRNKVKKYPNYEIQVLTKGLTKVEADELEVILISWYGRLDLGLGTLVNMTDGGDGTIGQKHSEERKKAASIRVKGENNPMFGKKGELNPMYKVPRTQEQKDYHSKAMEGNKSKSKEVIDTDTGIIYSCGKTAAETLKINYNTLRCKLNGSSKNDTTLRYIIQ